MVSDGMPELLSINANTWTWSWSSINVTTPSGSAYVKPTDLTDAQATCYLARFADLRQAFGNDLAAAKQHWKNYGINEDRYGECDSLFSYVVEYTSDTVGPYTHIAACDLDGDGESQP